MPVDDCKTCKHWHSLKNGYCSGGEWFPFGEIWFCRTQMIWLIAMLCEGELDNEHWPENPIGSSYLDSPITSRSFRNEAYFEKPSGMVGEVMKRLRKTGKEGKTLMEEIYAGLREYYLLSSVAKDALNYISVWLGRKESYRSFKYRCKNKGQIDAKNILNRSVARGVVERPNKCSVCGGGGRC